MTKPELSTSPEDVDDSFFVDCVVSQTGQRYILVTQGDTKVFLRRSLFVGPMQKALSALAEGGIELVSLVDKIKRKSPMRMAEFGCSGSLQAGTKRQIVCTSGSAPDHHPRQNDDPQANQGWCTPGCKGGTPHRDSPARAGTLVACAPGCVSPKVYSLRPGDTYVFGRNAFSWRSVNHAT